MMTEAEYASHVRLMSSAAGIASTASRRRHYEMLYYLHHKARGVRLRGKYRP